MRSFRWVILLALGMSSCVAPMQVQKKRSMSSVVPVSMSIPQEGNTSFTNPNPQCESRGDVRLGVLYVPSVKGKWKVLCFQRTSHSMGTANEGRLFGGQELGAAGHGWIQKGRNGFGTNETIQLLRWALGETVTAFPGTAPVYIGDISQEGGGSLLPHRSHQSGRDVDIGYYHVNDRPLRGFVDATSESLDVEKSWFLLEKLLLTGQVQYVFMDYRVQEWLFLMALNRGWSETDLKKLFQYPRGPRAHTGKIRHAPGHLNHFHVRFVCPDGDEECVNL